MIKMLLPRFLRFRKEIVLLWAAFWAAETPLHLKAATLFVAFYLINPMDILPDVIPLLGWADDLVLVPMMISWIVSRLPVRAKAYANPQDRRRASANTIDGTARRL
jgi:uncharacterized membrane protein YkvA (DUF1232 family)